MLSIVMLSVSATFAADDAASDVIAIDDEITIDEPLAVEETPTASANESNDVVTQDTFSKYFDGNGTLYANVTAEELTFNGDFANVGVDTIVLNRPITLIGDNSTLNNIAIDVKASDVAITGFTIVQNNGTAAISVSNATNVVIENTNINFNAIANSNGYAINADLANNLNLINNAITYVGATTGAEINNGIRVSNSNNATISGNKFNLALISAYVPWIEEPAGSWNYVAHPVSEGIVIADSKDVLFLGNEVNVTYNNVSGSYDTIYAVSFKNSDNAVISSNDIVAKGHTYIYGIQISGKDFLIAENEIYSESDNYYANGIDIEGPATGTVQSNVIAVKSVQSAYPIYSGMNGQNVSCSYVDNDISAESYFVIGMSLGDVESNIINNSIEVRGNYTTGIASNVANLLVEGNDIQVWSSQVGNESIWESFGVDSTGIKVFTGNATITDNSILADGRGVFAKDSSVNINNNEIKVASDSNNNAYAIDAENVKDLIISGNDIEFGGFTNGTAINNGIFVTKSDAAIIQGNNFTLSLVSAYVPWIEEPAGSWNYVAHPVSEGIVIADSNNVSFANNYVNVDYNDVSGSYDTIYAIAFKNSSNAIVNLNNIVAKGHTYIYALQMNGDNFNVSENKITAITDNYYANGIDIEGVASGVVKDNIIAAIGVNLSYPIYSGMNYKAVSAEYINNTLFGQAYFVLGMSLGDAESKIINNTIDILGNYTTGIGSNVPKLTVNGNYISAMASNVGNESIWETFGVETVGIKIANGVADITKNIVKTTGDYAVKVADTNSSVAFNELNAYNLTGDAAVNSTGNATVHDNLASAAFIYDETAKALLIDVAKKGYKYEFALVDDYLNPLANKNVTVTVNGVAQAAVTDAEGVVTVVIPVKKASVQTVAFKFDGDSDFGPAEGAATIKITKDKTKLSAKKKTAFKAKTKTKKLAVKLVDSKKKGIKKVKVAIKVNGKTYKAKTNKKGKAVFKITKLNKKGKYKAKIKFAGNTYYKAAKKSVVIVVKK